MTGRTRARSVRAALALVSILIVGCVIAGQYPLQLQGNGPELYPQYGLWDYLAALMRSTIVPPLTWTAVAVVALMLVALWPGLRRRRDT